MHNVPDIWVFLFGQSIFQEGHEQLGKLLGILKEKTKFINNPPQHNPNPVINSLLITLSPPHRLRRGSVHCMENKDQAGELRKTEEFG